MSELNSELAELSGPYYPNVHVQLTGLNGNAFVLIGAVRRALRRAGMPATGIEEFTAEASAGDYDALLRTCMRWVDVS